MDDKTLDRILSEIMNRGPAGISWEWDHRVDLRSDALYKCSPEIRRLSRDRQRG